MTAQKYLLLIGILILLHLVAQGQQIGNRSRGTEFSVETDPFAFLLDGYSAHLRVKPAGCKHLLFGAGIYALDLPPMLLDVNTTNGSEEWRTRLDQGYALFAEHHFREINRGWLAGSQVAFHGYEIRPAGEPGVTEFSTLLLRIYGGYTWRPFPFSLYLKPWGGIGYGTRVSGSTEVRGRTFDITPPPMFLFATVHVGYSF